MADEVKIVLTIEEKQALSAIRKLNDSVDKFGNEASKNFKKSSQAFNVFKGSLAASAATKGIELLKNAVVGFASTAINSAKQIETMEVGFTTLLRSGEAATEMVKELTDFTARTPFQLEGVASSAQQLLAFGFEADSITNKLQKIGDVAAGSGSDLKEVALIYGQVAAAGKLTGERLLQFQERAIPIGPAIAKTMGITEAAVKDAVSAGKVDLATFEKSFASLSQEGGLFYEGMVRQSKTLDGVMSTLDDNFKIVAAEIGQAFLPALKEAAVATIELLGAFREFVGEGSEFRKIVTGLFGDKESKQAQQLQIKIDNASLAVERWSERVKKAKANQGDGLFSSSVEDLERAEAELIKFQDKYAALLANKRQLEKESEDVAKESIEATEQEKTELLLQKETERIAAIKEVRALNDLEDQERIARAKLVEDEGNKAAQKSLIDSLTAQKAIKEKFNKEKLATLRKDVKDVEATERAKQAVRVQHFQLTSGLLNALSGLAALGGKKTFAITKALALAAIPLDTAAGIMKAFSTLPPPLSGIQAATVGVIGATQLARVAGSKPPSFEDGGFVPGTSYTGDNTKINANAGELILNQAQQEQTADNLSSRPMIGIFNIDGREIFRAVADQIEDGMVLPQGV